MESKSKKQLLKLVEQLEAIHQSMKEIVSGMSPTQIRELERRIQEKQHRGK